MINTLEEFKEKVLFARKNADNMAKQTQAILDNVDPETISNLLVANIGSMAMRSILDQIIEEFE